MTAQYAQKYFVMMGVFFHVYIQLCLADFCNMVILETFFNAIFLSTDFDELMLFKLSVISGR